MTRSQRPANRHSACSELISYSKMHSWQASYICQEHFQSRQTKFLAFLCFLFYISYKREQVYCFYTSPLLWKLYSTDYVCMYSYF